MRPAIIIGLGGTGARIVNNVYGRIPKEEREKSVFFVFDTDLGDMKELNHLDPKEDVISIGRSRTVQQLMVENQEKSFDYLTTKRDILGNNLADGAAQVRMLSRFAMENLQGDAVKRIVNKINKLASNRFSDKGANLYLVTSVAGGTGSGLLLPLAFSLKNYLSTALNRTLLVKAVVLFPDVYTMSNNVDMKKDEKRRVRSNAYAFFKEWKTYNDIFRGKYKYKENIDLMSLKLMDLGGMNALTPDRLTYNSDILDPIDLFVGIDAVGTTGTTLQYLENYEKMTENYLFLDLVSNFGSQAESRLDNALADFVTTNGMNRMSSFGSSSLIYPYKDILKFAPAVLMLNSLNDRWMQIDIKYQKEYDKYLKKRETDNQAKKPILSEFYIQTFDDYADTSFQQNYFKRLLESIKTQSVDDFGMVTGGVTYENNFFEKMNNHLTTQIKEKTFEYKGKSKKIISLEGDIKNLLSSVNLKGDYVDSIFSIEKLKKAFLYKAENETERIANDLLRNYLNMSDAKLQDINSEKQKDYNLTHYILGENETALHPVAVRYLLYKLSKRLKAEKESLFKVEYTPNGGAKNIGKIPSLKKEIEVLQNTDYYDKNDPTMIEDIITAIDMIKNEGDGKLFTSIFTNKKRQLKEVLGYYTNNIVLETESIRNYYQYKVLFNVYDEVEKRINLLIEYWENLFSNLKRGINDDRTILQERIAEFGEKRQSDSILGAIKLFDKYKLREDFVLDRLSNSSFNPDSFDYKVTELFYKDALSDFSQYPYEKEKGDIINKQFDEIVLEKLEDELNELGVFDINIIEALKDEARLKEIDSTTYISDKLHQIKMQAGPFMNPSIANASKRSFNAWGLNDETNDTLLQIYQHEDYMKLFGEENVLNQGDDNVVREDYESHIAAPAISKYEIIRSNFEYNFSLNNLPAFSAVTGIHNKITLKNVFNTGGVIYRSYYEQKHELWNHNEVSTHLDKRWDGLFVLNDINEGVDELFEEETKKAFLRGLAMKWFKSFKDNQTGKNSWKFEFNLGEENFSQELKHTNNEPAGATFYNLYEVLLDNIGLVLKINGYSDNFGKYINGFFDKQYTNDVEKQHNYDSWHKHKFIINITESIPYMLHTGTDYSIFDVFFRLHREKNTRHIKDLGKELLRLLIEELKDYQKRFGEDTFTINRVREVVKEILRKSYCSGKIDCGKNGLRETWIEIIIDKLGYKSRDIELQDIFLMKSGYYIKDKGDKNEENTNNED